MNPPDWFPREAFRCWQNGQEVEGKLAANWSAYIQRCYVLKRQPTQDPAKLIKHLTDDAGQPGVKAIGAKAMLAQVHRWANDVTLHRPEKGSA